MRGAKTSTMSPDKPVSDAAILFYEKKDKYYEFSNFYESPIKVDGRLYPTTEHFYQARKFIYPGASQASLDYAEVISQTNTPNKAFILANQKKKGGWAAKWTVSKTDKRTLNSLIDAYKNANVTIRPDWDQVKDDVMREAVWAKFTQHPHLQQLLLDTGDLNIAENSPRDSYWGLGSDGQGLNRLGKILMEVRSRLKGA